MIDTVALRSLLNASAPLVHWLFANLSAAALSALQRDYEQDWEVYYWAMLTKRYTVRQQPSANHTPEICAVMQHAYDQFTGRNTMTRAQIYMYRWCQKLTTMIESTSDEWFTTLISGACRAVPYNWLIAPLTSTQFAGALLSGQVSDATLHKIFVRVDQMLAVADAGAPGVSAAANGLIMYCEEACPYFFFSGTGRKMKSLKLKRLFHECVYAS